MWAAVDELDAGGWDDLADLIGPAGSAALFRASVPPPPAGWSVHHRGLGHQMTVTAAAQGSIDDLSSYVLDDRTKASTPYYVNVSVKNVGDGDVGQTPIPLWAVDRSNTLIQASSFTNSFTRCPSTPLPTTFAPNATIDACLVYLVPDHGTLTGLSFRPLQAVAPIVWKGDVTPPAAPPTPQKTKKKAS